MDITATSGAKGRILLVPESVTVGKDSSEIYDTENTENSTTEFAKNSEAKKQKFLLFLLLEMRILMG